MPRKNDIKICSIWEHHLWVLKKALNNRAGSQLPDLLMDLAEVKLQFTLLPLLRED